MKTSFGLGNAVQQGEFCVKGGTIGRMQRKWGQLTCGGLMMANGKYRHNRKKGAGGLTT